MTADSPLYPYFRAHPHVTTDSRKVEPGDLFFALSGPHFDGNTFAKCALEAGASYAVVSSPEIAEQDSRYLYVPDTLQALQELAHTHRRHFNIPVIAITGTNGKTTTKELSKSVLSQKYRLLATEGNLNNHIGVPLTLLRLTDEHEIALVEMGASSRGEIALLAQIAAPTVGLITNVGKAHLEGFGSIDGVLEAKSELPEYLREHDGVFFLNADDDRLFRRWSSFALMKYGIKADRDPVVTASILSDHPFLEMAVSKDGEELFLSSTHLTGRYNYQNVLAATTLGLHFGVPHNAIIEAIESYFPSNSRSQVIECNGDVTVIMDAYNANPSSMLVALENLSALSSSHKVAILGEMLELGASSESEHRAILEWLSGHTDISAYLCGKEFVKVAEGKYPVSPDVNELVSHLSGLSFPPGTTLLIKGSRGVALENVLPVIRGEMTDDETIDR